MGLAPLVFASDTPVPKDVVIATMGASAALGGLILVFLGLLIASYQSLPPGTMEPVKKARRRPAWPVLAVFALSVVSVALGFWWLEGRGDSTLYAANNAVFAAELVAIVGVAIRTATQILK
jgi:hypothetical protein